MNEQKNELYEREKKVSREIVKKNIFRYIDEIEQEKNKLDELTKFLQEAHSALETKNIEYDLSESPFTALMITSNHIFTRDDSFKIDVGINGAEKRTTFRDVTLRKCEFNDSKKIMIRLNKISNDKMFDEVEYHEQNNGQINHS